MQAPLQGLTPERLMLCRREVQGRSPCCERERPPAIAWCTGYLLLTTYYLLLTTYFSSPGNLAHARAARAGLLFGSSSRRAPSDARAFTAAAVPWRALVLCPQGYLVSMPAYLLVVPATRAMARELTSGLACPPPSYDLLSRSSTQRDLSTPPGDRDSREVSLQARANHREVG